MWFISGQTRPRMDLSDLETIAGIDGINILAAPGFTDPGSHEVLISAGETRTELFAILDTPETIDTVANLAEPVATGGLRPRSSALGNAALYTPWIIVVDPVIGQKVNAPPSGHVAGIYAGMDTRRGVHKAPANEIVRGALDLTVSLSEADQAVLNPAGVNCIRRFEDGIKGLGCAHALRWRKRVAICLDPAAGDDDRTVDCPRDTLGGLRAK